MDGIAAAVQSRASIQSRPCRHVLRAQRPAADLRPDLRRLPVPVHQSPRAKRRLGDQPFRGLAGPAGTAVQPHRQGRLGDPLAAGLPARLRRRRPRGVRPHAAVALAQRRTAGRRQHRRTRRGLRQHRLPGHSAVPDGARRRRHGAGADSLADRGLRPVRPGAGVHRGGPAVRRRLRPRATAGRPGAAEEPAGGRAAARRGLEPRRRAAAGSAGAFPAAARRGHGALRTGLARPVPRPAASGAPAGRAAAGGAQVGRPAAADLVRRLRAARPAAAVGARRAAAQRPAHRHRAVHARRVLPPRGGAGVAHHPAVHPRLAGQPVAAAGAARPPRQRPAGRTTRGAARRRLSSRRGSA